MIKTTEIRNKVGAQRKSASGANHLGNNRLSFMRNAGTVAIVKETNYYPFGLTQKGYNNLTTSLGSAAAKKYLYNGKELQEDFGLEWYDYGARFYDASLGRWFVPDPMAEKAPSWTPYRYAFNNPVNITDPDGMFEDWVEKTLTDGTKKVEWDKNVTSSDDPDLKSGDKYWGKTGYGVEGTGEDEKLVYYGSNGQKKGASIGLNEVEVTSKMTDYQRTLYAGNKLGIYKIQQDFLENPITQAAFNTLLFVAIGGVEGVMSLRSAGVKVFAATSTSVKEAAGATAEKAVGTLAGKALKITKGAQDAPYVVGTFLNNTKTGQWISAFVEANAPVGTVSAAQTTAGKKAGAEIVSKTIELLESGKNKRQYQSRNKKEK